MSHAHEEHRSAASMELDGDTLSGLAVPWNQPSRMTYEPVLRREFQEIFVRGAIDINQPSAAILTLHHDRRTVMASTRATGESGRIVLADEVRGLSFRVQMPNIQLARDCWQMVRDGVLSSVSISFRRAVDSWPTPTLRRVTSAVLTQISIVETGAYPQTVAEARSLKRLNAALRLRLGG